MNDRSTDDQGGLQFSPVTVWRKRKMRFVRNRLILKLETRLTLHSEYHEAVGEFLKTQQVDVRRFYVTGNLAVVDIEPPRYLKPGEEDEVLLRLIDEISLTRGVAFAEPDLAMSPLGVGLPRDPGLVVAMGEQWGWMRIGMGEVWKTYPGNENVLVCILDTGYLDHVDFDLTRLEMQEYYDGTGTVGNDATDLAEDPLLRGHGTKVSGLIAASQDNIGIEGITGINAGSLLYFCNVLPEGSSAIPNSNFYDAVVNIISYLGATDRKAVVNISLKAEFEPTETDTCEELPSGLDTLKDMCEAAKESNRVILCCGAGNHEGRAIWPARFEACYPNTVLSVGATTIDPYEIRGDNAIESIQVDDETVEGIWNLSATGDEISVVAPGSHLKVIVPEFTDTSSGGSSVPSDEVDTDAGTSLSTAFVTGLASLMWSANPDLSREAIVTAIKSTASVPNYIEEKPAAHWGHGRINAPEALEAVLPKPAAVVVADVTDEEADALEQFAKILSIITRVYLPYLNVGIPEVTPRAGDTAIGSDSEQLSTAFAAALRATPGNLDKSMDIALQMLRHHTGPIAEAQPQKCILVLAGAEASLSHETMILLRRAQLGTSIPVHIVHMGHPLTPEHNLLTRAADLTNGEIVSSIKWANEVEVGYAISRIAALAMGRTIVLDQFWAPTDTSNIITFQFDLDRTDLDVDVMMFFRKSSVDNRLLTVNGVNVLSSPRSLPGVVIDKGNRFFHARIATGTQATSGNWQGEVTMVGPHPDNATAFTLLVSKRSKGD